MKKHLALQVPWSDALVLPNSPSVDRIAQSNFGTRKLHGNLLLSPLEAVFLHAKGSIVLTNAKAQPLSMAQLERLAKRVDPDFSLRYAVYSDLREKGHVVKSGMKYGNDFRVYEKGKTDTHSSYIVHPVRANGKLGWNEFAGKNRLAHGTRKRLLLAIVDEDGDVLYYEIKWVRP